MKTKIEHNLNKHLDKPYLARSSGPEFFDCSGLLYHVLNESGIKIPALTAQGYFNLSKEWNIIKPLEYLEDTTPGDLIFVENNSDIWIGEKIVKHVMIPVSNGFIVHATNRKDVKKVIKENTNDYQIKSKKGSYFYKADNFIKHAQDKNVIIKTDINQNDEILLEFLLNELEKYYYGEKEIEEEKIYKYRDLLKTHGLSFYAHGSTEKGMLRTIVYKMREFQIKGDIPDWDRTIEQIHEIIL